MRERPPPDSDRLIAAMLCGAAKHHARWRDLTEDEHAAAVAELHELATGRANAAALLAEEAGLMIGFSEGAMDESFDRRAGELLIAAGADVALVPQWVEEGRSRRRPCRRRERRPG